MELLLEHRLLPLSSEEDLAVSQTIEFVKEHTDCLVRSCLKGHLTGSAWVVSPDRRKVLLTHHRKLKKWLQLGGHADGDGNLLAVALREAKEESGLKRLKVVQESVFDVDRHWIPGRGKEPGHWHHDLRFILEADPREKLTATSESKDLAWADVAAVASLNPEESMSRMVRKTLAAWPGIGATG
jgi:8-oxo-dGTP pyrophosphatase MutT (NUDIX family)